MEAATPLRPLPARVAFREFLRQFRWQQGEHVTLVGPTGAGKTTLIRELIPMRRHVAFLATKRRDSTLDEIESDGFERSQRLYDWQPRVIVYPPFPKDADKMFKEHRKVFRTVLMDAYHAGNWCIVADEVRYIIKQLGLEREMQILWLQGRSLGVSVLASTQRPRHIPLEAYDQATHLFLWRDNDRQNLQRLSELGGSVDVAMIQNVVRELPRHDFLYVSTRTGDTLISNAKEG